MIKSIKLLNALLLILSPLAVLMFVVGVIVLLDRSGTHQGFLRRLEQSGVVAQATVERVDSAWIVVRFADPNESEPRIGLVRPFYYSPEVVSALRPGAPVSVRYLAPAYENEAVLNDHYADVRSYWGFVLEPALMMLIAWLVIIFYPDVLFWGFIDDYAEVRQARTAR